MTLSTFRSTYPEFSNTSSYPDAMVNVYLNLSSKVVSEDRWGDCYDLGVGLFIAHNLVLAKSNVDASTAGSLPGQTSGPTASKAVGSVSVSYDTNNGSELSAGHWNLTSYGKQYIRYAKMFGAGAVQL
jgi:hypothetical protein